LTIAGGFDKRLVENIQYLEELKCVAMRERVADRVEFVTSCSTTQRNKLLSECLCVIYTPKDELFGIVPLEAMASQKPVIACNSGGSVETIKHAATGFLCEPTPHTAIYVLIYPLFQCFTTAHLSPPLSTITPCCNISSIYCSTHIHAATLY
jgi:glycosyltransferase involved in cell wall biosynthesis